MKRYFSIAVKTGIIPFIVILSCAPATLYTINMNYAPSGIVSAGSGDPGDIRFTVARFIDSREIEDKMMIGRVISGDGVITPVTLKHLNPEDTITTGVRKCLSAGGYSLSPEIPLWNLDSNSVGTRPGSILIGGTIDTLEVVCRKDGIKKHYNANVTLTIVFTDVHASRIVHTIETTSNPSLVHIHFSEQILEEQINKALSASIEQALGNRDNIQKIVTKIHEK